MSKIVMPQNGSFSRTLQLRCKFTEFGYCRDMLSVVCLLRDCIVTRRLKSRLRGFHIAYRHIHFAVRMTLK